MPADGTLSNKKMQPSPIWLRDDRCHWVQGVGMEINLPKYRTSADRRPGVISLFFFFKHSVEMQTFLNCVFFTSTFGEVCLSFARLYNSPSKFKSLPTLSPTVKNSVPVPLWLGGPCSLFTSCCCPCARSARADGRSDLCTAKRAIQLRRAAVWTDTRRASAPRQ